MQIRPLLVALALSAGACAHPVDRIDAGAENADPDAAGFSWYFATPDKEATLFVFEIGRGEPYFVLHGGPGGDMESLRGLEDGLTDTHRFIFYNRRGSVRSPAATDNVTLDKHVADLDALRAELGIEKANIISHSAGTMVAMRYLIGHPDTTGNVVLLGALDVKNGGDTFGEFEQTVYAEKEVEFAAFVERQAVKDEIRNAGLDDPTNQRDRDRLRHLNSAAANVYDITKWRDFGFYYVSRDAALATRGSTSWDYDWRPILQSPPGRVSVINGEFDYIVGPRNSPTWRSAIENDGVDVELTVIPNAGHAVWVDQPEMFRDALVAAMTPETP